jgi:3,4-dihydroxy 2-butanone 4-phosphate synthase/GTP cyclohydrolase II
MIEAAGEGVVVYLRQEGRGIGLVNKLRAYSLQDGGLDTVEANERLGFPADLRNYGVGAQILSDLGVRHLRLITNNPRKIAGLDGYGLQVDVRVPLVIDAGVHNAAYLSTKRLKLGHLMESLSPPEAASDSPGPTAVVAWQADGDDPQRDHGHLQELQRWAEQRHLRLAMEDHPRLLALLEGPSLAALLTAQPDQTLQPADLAEVLTLLGHWPQTRAVTLLLAPDGPRSSHPSAQLDPERRPLVELKATPACPWLKLEPGAFIRWQR